MSLTNKEILHRILKGMDPYISCGVPKVYLDLAKELTKEVYGRYAVTKLERFVKENDNSVQANEELLGYCIDGWDDPNTHVGPEELIAKFEHMGARNGQ